jgi:hypothetical protein
MTAAFTACALTVHETVVVELYPTSGCTFAWHVPSVCFEAGSVIVKVTVDGAIAPTVPPRFLSLAATTQGDPQPEASTDTTV